MPAGPGQPGYVRPAPGAPDAPFGFAPKGGQSSYTPMPGSTLSPGITTFPRATTGDQSYYTPLPDGTQINPNLPMSREPNYTLFSTDGGDTEGSPGGDASGGTGGGVGGDTGGTGGGGDTGGSGGDGPNSGDSQPPGTTAPTQANQIDEAINNFTRNIAPFQYNMALSRFSGVPDEAVWGANAALGGYGGASGASGTALNNQFRNVMGQTYGISQNNDPRFAAYASGQNAVLERQRNQSDQQLRQDLARQGIVGTAAQNDVNRLNEGFDVRQQALSGDVGMQQLNRQDTALNQFGNQAMALNQANQSNLGQKAGFSQQQFGNTAAASQANNAATQQWLEAQAAASASMAADPSLRIAALAAQNGGNVGGGGKSSPLGK